MTESNGKINIEGYYFSLVKNGVDEEQVSKALADLTNKCKQLTDSNQELKKIEEHYASLTRLAEKTVIDADLLANDIKAKAENSAKAVTENAYAKTNAMYEQTTKEIQQLASKFISMVQDMEKSIIGEANKRLSPDKSEKLSTEDEADEPNEGLTHQAESFDNREIGIEIVPPFDINAVMRVIEHLGTLPQVLDVELISRVNEPLVIVYLKQPLDILEILETLPDIEEVSESCESEQARQIFAIRTRVAEPSSSYEE